MKKLLFFAFFLLIVVLSSATPALADVGSIFAPSKRSDPPVLRGSFIVVYVDEEKIVAIADSHSVVSWVSMCLHQYASHWFEVGPNRKKYIRARVKDVYVDHRTDLAYIVYAQTPDTHSVIPEALSQTPVKDGSTVRFASVGQNDETTGKVKSANGAMLVPVSAELGDSGSPAYLDDKVAARLIGIEPDGVCVFVGVDQQTVTRDLKAVAEGRCQEVGLYRVQADGQIPPAAVKYLIELQNEQKRLKRQREQERQKERRSVQLAVVAAVNGCSRVDRPELGV
ncbi:MAG: hypothetical protein IKS14_00150 [Thermoguttaceae bacterium]|nr:hypothetical protein [Thermoguttaceae bacterium]